MSPLLRGIVSNIRKLFNMTPTNIPPPPIVQSDHGQLFRASELFMAVFYVFRQKLYERLYDSSKADKRSNGKINIYTYDKPDVYRLQEYIHTPEFSPEDNAAVFTSQTCWMPSEMFRPLIETLIGDISTKMQTWHVRFHETHIYAHGNSPHRPFIGASPGLWHTVLLITLSNPLSNTPSEQHETRYVLDISGAQYNQHRALHTFESYERYFAAEAEVPALLSSPLQEDPNGDGEVQPVMYAQSRAAEAICEWVGRDEERVKRAMKFLGDVEWRDL